MKLSPDEGATIVFYNTTMVFKATLAQTHDQYATILMTHPPLAGPALHQHPDGVETFYIVEGNYDFVLGGDNIPAEKGDFILIPKGVPHQYKSGPQGGKVLVTTPPGVATYFTHIADLLKKGKVTQEYEFAFAAAHGQTFLDKKGHWTAE